MAPPPDQPRPWSTPTRGKTVRGGFPPKARAEILERDPLCQLALPGCDGPSRQADHIVNWPTALGAGWTLARYNDPSNGQGACLSCHALKTAAEAAAGRDRARAERQQRRGKDDRHPGIIEPPTSR